MADYLDEFLITDSVHADTMNSKLVTPLNVLALDVTGKLDSTGDTAENLIVRNYTEILKTLTSTDASTSGAVVLNLAEANVFNFTVNTTDAQTLTLSNEASGAHSFSLFLHQSTVAPAVTLDFGSSSGALLWSGDAIPEIADGETNIFTFASLDAGDDWYGHHVGDTYGDGST